MMNELALINQADKAIQEAGSVFDLTEIINKAHAIATIANANKMNDLAAKATAISLKAKYRAGEMLDAIEPGKTGPKLGNTVLPNRTEYQQVLEDSELNKMTASRWKSMIKLPKDEFISMVETAVSEHRILTQREVIRAANGAHVGHNSGENEWYTPAKYIEAARRVMGGIDLDPASSDEANEIIKATMYYTEETDGLAWDWEGRVWMNPPYAQPLISHFCEKLTIDLDMGFVTEAITLTNNATETKWFQGVSSRCAAVCFPTGRIHFMDIDGNPGGAPLQGQAILYFGSNVERFAAEFGQFGSVFYAARQD